MAGERAAADDAADAGENGFGELGDGGLAVEDGEAGGEFGEVLGLEISAALAVVPVGGEA